MFLIRGSKQKSFGVEVDKPYLFPQADVSLFLCTHIVLGLLCLVSPLQVHILPFWLMEKVFFLFCPRNNFVFLWLWLEPWHWPLLAINEHKKNPTCLPFICCLVNQGAIGEIYVKTCKMCKCAAGGQNSLAFEAQSCSSTPKKISFQSGFCALDPPLSCFLKVTTRFSACWLESGALSHTRKSLGKSEIDL